MYDYGDSWSSRFLLLTGEFGCLPLVLISFVAGVVLTLIGVGVWNWLT